MRALYIVDTSYNKNNTTTYSTYRNYLMGWRLIRKVKNTTNNDSTAAKERENILNYLLFYL
jgi:hypothetical protein